MVEKTSIVTGISAILFYLVFLFLYLQDVINEFIFLFILLISLLIMVILFLLFRKKRDTKRKIAIATCIIFLLFCYEFPLIGYYKSPSHLAYAYIEPTEAVEGSEIYSIGVNELTIENEKSIQAVKVLLIKQYVDVLSVFEVNKKTIYGSKNRQILRWLHLQKDHSPEEMKENVSLYLGNENEWLTTFLSRDIGGDSAGLSLALSGRFKQNDFQN